MKTAYFDCFSGAAGDMILAALLDAGLSADVLTETLAKLKLTDEVTLEAQRVQRHSLAATYLRVRINGVPEGHSHTHTHAHSHGHDHSHDQSDDHAHEDAHAHAHSHSHRHDHAHGDDDAQRHHHHHHAHRHLPEILAIIEAAEFSPRVTQQATQIFRRLAEAEAAVHGTTPDEVHFHEVGAADAILDICGACVALETLGIERVLCSPIPPGSGQVRCDHGLMPVPAPATAQLLRGFPIAACDEPGELCTPTGAAILTTLADEFVATPAMQLETIGVGAGTRVGKTRPNILRVLIGQTETPHDDASERDTVTVLETQIDDVSGQVVGFTVETLLAKGALDAYSVPIMMKKGRPAHLLTVITRPADAERLAQVVLNETGSLGVRRSTLQRTKRARQHETVDTRFGPIRIKVALQGEQVVSAQPEYDDCARAARTDGVPLRDVQAAAMQAYQRDRYRLKQTLKWIEDAERKLLNRPAIE